MGKRKAGGGGAGEDEAGGGAGARAGAELAAISASPGTKESTPKSKPSSSSLSSKRRRKSGGQTANEGSEKKIKLRAVVPKVVPWIDWDEWLNVAENVFSDDKERARVAVERIRTWQSRGKVPHSAEATAALVEINCSSDQHSVYELRLMYSMSIIRFVNGIVDSVQQRKFASPISDLAEHAAVPRILVDIRHAASHNNLPTLPVLRVATESALAWLRHHYWDPQAATLKNAKDFLEPCIRDYVGVRSRLIAVASKKVTDKTDKTKLETKKRELEEKSLELLRLILQSTPITDIHNSLILHIFKTSILILQETLADVIDAKRTPTKKDFDRITHYVFDIWKVALQEFTDQYPQFRGMFNSALLDALSLLSIFEKAEAGGSPMKDLLPLKTAEETSTFGLILVEWISSVNTDDKGSNWKDDDEVKRIVRCCVDSPSAWSLSILEKISASSKGREVARALEYLRGFQSFFDEKPSISSATSELGMEEVCKDLSMWEERSQRRHAPSMRGWSVVEDWLPCPIGTVFGKQVSLRLGEEDCKEEQTETVLDTALPPFPRAHEQAITSPREEAEGGRTERACSPVDKGACAVSDLIDETWIHKTSSMIKLLV